MSRPSTNVRNSGWNLANILIYPTAFLAMTPFFIDQLGEYVFGQWMLINSYVFIAVHLVGFGLPFSITAHVAEALGKDDTPKMYAYINAASRLLGRMMGLLSLLGGLLYGLALWDPGVFSDGLWTILSVATFFIAIKFPEVLFQSIFKGFEQYHKAAIFNMLNRLLALSLHFILIYLGYGLLAVFMASFVVNTLVVGIQAWVIFSRMKGFRLQIWKPLQERKALYHFGFWTWLQTIIAVASYQMDRFLVAFYLGTAAVTYFVLAATIANHLHMAFEAVVSWFLPKVARLKASLGETRSHFYSIRAFSVGFSLLVILFIYLISEPLFILWLGPDKYAKMIDFFKLFLIFEAFLVLAIVPKLYLNAIKSLSFITSLEFMYKTAIIVGMVLCFSWYGSAQSLIWGQNAAMIVFMPVMYYLVNKRALHSGIIKETFLNIVPSLAVMGAILSTSWMWIGAYLLLAIISFIFIYIRNKDFNLKLLFE